VPEKEVEITPIKEVVYEEKDKSPSMHNPVVPPEEEKMEVVEESGDESSMDGDSEYDNEATSPPHDVISIYCLTPDEMILDLCSYAYDPVLKQLNRETNYKVLKGDGT